MKKTGSFLETPLVLAKCCYQKYRISITSQLVQRIRTYTLKQTLKAKPPSKSSPSLKYLELFPAPLFSYAFYYGFQVIGVKNLRIADANIFPRIPSGSIAASCMAIAETLADILQADNP